MTPMIVVQISNGLGNQLFQYAAARALALRLNAPLKLATDYFEQWQDRVFQLERFRVHASRLTDDERAMLGEWRRGWRKRASRGLSVLGLQLGPRWICDYEESWHDRWARLSGTMVLEGFWQSEKYFAPVSSIIRRELRMDSEVDEGHRRLFDEMRGKNAVAIHIRRGDYTTTAQNSHGACSLDYYSTAIQCIRSEVAEPSFYVFSDEPEWALHNLKIDGPVKFVTKAADADPVNDLRLMSECRHFIIANSTFSWWGAWLSEHSRKVIVAPRRWFGREIGSASDLIPDGWIKV